MLPRIGNPSVPGSPGSGPARPGALSSANPRVNAVLQGTDWIKPDSAASDFSISGNEKPIPSTFPYLGTAHPLPGEAGTVGFPALGNTPEEAVGSRQ